MILDEIIINKKEELQIQKKTIFLKQLEDLVEKVHEAISFDAALKKDLGSKNRIIAEVKKASPSKGVIREKFFPVEIAREYEANGAVAVSVLTDEKFFMGKLEYLTEIKKNVLIPVLRKDFLFDPYQIYESKAYGADALLLIAAVLEKELLRDLLQLVSELGLCALVEVHTKQELRMAIDAGSQIIGINNRNLQTFKTDIQTTIDLIDDIPDGTAVVSESGIETTDDISRLKDVGVDAFLIGESLLREENPGQKLKEFVWSSYGISR
jgi:indole-3-glycerol phosphate synthase